MKYRFFTTALLLSLSSLLLAQEKTSSFKVSGNCEMCRKRIETAARSAGVKAVSWDATAQLARVSFDSSKVSLSAVQKKISEAGYDTQLFRATDSAYFKLPGCCQYERDAADKKRAQ